MLAHICLVFFVSFGHSKSLCLLKQAHRRPGRPLRTPRFLAGFNNSFLPLLQNSLRHAQRVLAQTGFAIHQRAVTDVTAHKMNRAKKVVSERPFGPVRLVIGDIRGASRPFGWGGVGWRCLDIHYKYDTHGTRHTVTDSVYKLANATRSQWTDGCVDFRAAL